MNVLIVITVNTTHTKYKQGPRNWLCQAAGAAAPSGGSVHTKWESVGVK